VRQSMSARAMHWTAARANVIDVPHARTPTSARSAMLSMTANSRDDCRRASILMATATPRARGRILRKLSITRHWSPMAAINPQHPEDESKQGDSTVCGSDHHGSWACARMALRMMKMNGAIDRIQLAAESHETLADDRATATDGSVVAPCCQAIPRCSGARMICFGGCWTGVFGI
jgi:hypothetical protein